MTGPPRLLFILDTPNVWRGRALAGTPARVLALAQHACRAGATVTLALCDRGADYGSAEDWATGVVVMHPIDFYEPARFTALLSDPVDFVVMCEAEALLGIGRELSRRLGAHLVYDVHDDDAAVARTLGEPAQVVNRHALAQGTALKTADHVIVSTRGEHRLASAAGVDPSQIALLPNGADPTRRTCWGPETDALTMVFLGNLYYQPNARAVTAIRKVLLPGLHGLGVQAQARIVGHGPAELLAQPTPGIDFLGRVPTVDQALQGCIIALAPLTAGSGAKMKVLDYMAAGLPVVGTTEAVTGLPPHHPGVIVEDDLAAWAPVIADLVCDPHRLHQIGEQGRACIETELSWTRIGTGLVRHARDWLRRPVRQDHHAAPPADIGTPRWHAEHSGQDALPDPGVARARRAHWIRRSAAEHVDRTGR